MYNLTKMKIASPVENVFEAIVDPEKMSNYWFSGSGRLIQGETITWRYEEYNAEVEINVQEVEAHRKIVFSWGGSVVTITLEEQDPATTIIEVKEEGFTKDDPELISKLLDNKEGWVYVLTCLKGYLDHLMYPNPFNFYKYGIKAPTSDEVEGVQKIYGKLY
nr:SRPBCC family protein [Tumebacillus sp. BK434]